MIILFYHEETEDDVESQHLDEINPQREKVSKEHPDEPKICKRIREYLQIKNKKSIIFASLITLTLTIRAYLGLYDELSTLTMAAQTVIVSSEGPAAEMYPDSMGQYQLAEEVISRWVGKREWYQHRDRDDRFLMYNDNGNNAFPAPIYLHKTKKV